MVKIGIIGGSGLEDPQILKNAEQIKVHTPYGAPSDLVTVGKIGKVDVVLLPRHGKKHHLNPGNVNYRANVWALKSLGVSHIIAPGAVGSLKEEYRPGEIVFTDQFIDRTYSRKTTFYEGQQVCHISVAEPFCPELRKKLIESARKLGLRFHEKGTCVVIEGPRFSTKAESELYRSWNADIINMTLCPEAVLAREAEICYANIAMVTDYDCWRDSHVSSDEVMKTMKENADKVKRLIVAVIPAIKDKKTCGCGTALKSALL